MTPGKSLVRCAVVASLRMSLRTSGIKEVRQSTVGRHGTRDTPSVNGCASVWRRSFGWCKTVGGMRRSRFKGRERTQLFALIVGTAYNLMRMARILREPAVA
jgi:hypothetical protein